MTRQFARWTWGAALLVASLALDARAQVTNPYANLPSRPTTSPYLGLTQRDNFGVIPYYTQVRPQIEQQQQISQQQQQLVRLQQQYQSQSAIGAARTGATRIGPTGRDPRQRTPRYFFTSHFYPDLRPSRFTK